MKRKTMSIIVCLTLVMTAFAIVPLNVSAASEEDIEQAIEDGIVWLVAQQNTNAMDPDFGSWDAYGGELETGTGLALYKLCERAYELGYDSPFDSAYEYHQNVMDGFNWTFAHLTVVDIFVQDHTSGATGTMDDPDTNGNGLGVTTLNWYSSYTTGILLAAIAASGTPSRVVNVLGSPVNGWTFGQVAQDMVDFLAFSQVDPSINFNGDTVEGGWDYLPVDNGVGGTGWQGDQSNSGYAVLGLGEAQAFGCIVPQWVKTELDWWIDYVQDDVDGDASGWAGSSNDGGSWYSYTGDFIGVNILKTGNLIFQMAFVGDMPTTQRVTDATDYLVRHWGDPSGTDQPPGWNGTPAQYQAMFCAMKGLEYMGIDIFDGIDWFEDFSDVIVAQQDKTPGPTYGSWQNSSGRGEPVIITEWALLTLEKVAPPPQVIPPTVTKTVDPEDIYFGTEDKESTVTIEVTGAGGTETTITPMDVVFAIDSSGSMNWNDPSNLRLTAAKNFVDNMSDTRDQGGVVSWDDHIDFTYGLSQDFTELKNQIDNVDSSGGTDLNQGLNASIAMLDAGKQWGATWVIIFLTDGQGLYTPSGSPGSPADVAAGKGYVIYSIGLNMTPGSLAENNLIDMATATGGQYYSSPSAENLSAIYDAIYEEITTSTVPHYVNVTEVTQSYIIVDETSFNIAPDSVTHNADGTTTIIWENIGMYADGDPDLSADETVILSFNVRSSICGADLEVDVYGEAIVNYSDKDGNYIGFVLIPQATINVHPFVTDLIAGGGNPNSAIDVGEVIAWNDEDFLYVTYNTTDDWYITETHLHVADSLEGIPQTKKGNPIPGQFDYGDEYDYDDGMTTVTYTIPWTWSPGTTLYIAAHAVVQKLIGYDEEGNPIYQIETAWGDGEDFPGKNWATYFEYIDP